MSTQITVAQVDQFSNNIEHLTQQGDCRFTGKLRTETQVGKSKFFEQLGATAAVKRTARHADTPRVDSVHERREVRLNDYDWSDLIDTLDPAKMLISPQSSYAQSAAMAFNRAKDQEIIDNATGSAYANKSGDGATGTTATVLPATQKIAVDHDVAATNTGLTLGKLIGTKSVLGKNEVPKGSKIYFVHTQQQLDDLLVNVNEVQSSDYAAVKALNDGEVSYFMGMEFIKTELLDLGTLGTDIRKCFAYAHNGLLLSLGQDFKARVAERADKNHATQVYANMSVGSTRMQESMVVEVACDESP